MKKLLLSFALVCACALLFAAAALAAEEDWEYYDNETGVTIFYYKGSATEVTVPSTLGGKTVTEIYEHAFSHSGYCVNGDKLTKITLPDTVKTIGMGAFSECSNLKSVNIPSGITRLEGGTFYHCESLTSISIPAGVTHIGGNCFEGCTGLTSITLPSGITALEMDTFLGCTGLTGITIPENVTSIGYGCFWSCSGLKRISIPSKVTEIGEAAFYQCTALVKVTLPSGLKSIGKSCFDRCFKLSSINLPSGLTKLDEYVFFCCTSLPEITIPDGLTAIGDHCFNQCSNLKTVTIPRSVASIGDYTFYACHPVLRVVSGSYAEQYADAKGLDKTVLYSVKFNSNGGSAVGEQTVEGGETAAQPADPTKGGFAFVGWFSDSALTKEFDFSTPITKNTTVYAKWSNEYFSVAFDTNGGSAVATQNVLSGKKAVKPNDPVKDGFAFAGWFSDSALTKEFDFSKPITAATIVYAKWSSSYYTVTFNSNGGSAVASQTVAKGAKPSKPEDPTKDGSVFAGWYSDAALKTAYDFAAEVTADITLYAKWNEIYTVEFDSNGGTAVPAQFIESGKTAVRPADPNMSMRVFAGWYSDAALTSQYDFSKPVTADITLYAKWHMLYTVTFDSNGGSAISNQYIEEGKQAEEPYPPTKEGFAFAGWYKDSALTTPFDFTTPITADVTLWAKWAEATPEPTATTPPPADPTTPVPTTPAPTTPAPTLAPTPTPAPVAVTSIKLSADFSDLYMKRSGGGYLQLEVETVPANADVKSVTWASDKPRRASVDHAGLVTAVKKGKAVITVTVVDAYGKSFTASCEVTVKKNTKKVTKVKLDVKSITLRVGETFKPTVTIKPATAYEDVIKWKSSNKKIAKVAKDGTITAKKKGTCKITATSKSGKKATIKVKVKK